METLQTLDKNRNINTSNSQNQSNQKNQETLPNNSNEKYERVEEIKNEKLLHVYQVDKAFSEILRQSAIEMAELTKSVDENNKIPNFGAKAAGFIEKALENFESKVGKTSDPSFILKKKTRTRSHLGYKFKLHFSQTTFYSQRTSHCSF